MEYGCRKIRLLGSLKSDIKITVMFFFGMRNVGAPHWERLTLFMKLISSSLSSSCLNVSSCMRGTENGFPFYGSASGLSLIL